MKILHVKLPRRLKFCRSQILVSRKHLQPFQRWKVHLSNAVSVVCCLSLKTVTFTSKFYLDFDFFKTSNLKQFFFFCWTETSQAQKHVLHHRQLRFQSSILRIRWTTAMHQAMVFLIDMNAFQLQVQYFYITMFS